MKTALSLPKTASLDSSDLALSVHEGIYGYNADRLLPQELADNAPALTDQYRADEGQVNNRYTGGDMYDYINAQATLPPQHLPGGCQSDGYIQKARATPRPKSCWLSRSS